MVAFPNSLCGGRLGRQVVASLFLLAVGCWCGGYVGGLLVGENVIGGGETKIEQSSKIGLEDWNCSKNFAHTSKAVHSSQSGQNMRQGGK